MLYIFPNVAIQLNAEDEGLRARAVALLGRLFAATHAEYGQEYPRIFREFLGRFKDKEPALRSQLVGIGAAIMQRKPRLAEQIVPLLQARLQDPVRVCVFRCVCFVWIALNGRRAVERKMGRADDHQLDCGLTHTPSTPHPPRTHKHASGVGDPRQDSEGGVPGGAQAPGARPARARPRSRGAVRGAVVVVFVTV